MTVFEYEKLFGVAPQNDDLELTICDLEGQDGHKFCGICYNHYRPRHMCGCPAVSPSLRYKEDNLE